MGANKDCRTSGDLLTPLHFAVKGYVQVTVLHVNNFCCTRVGLKCELELGKG